MRSPLSHRVRPTQMPRARLGLRWSRFLQSVRFRLTLWFGIILAIVLLVFSLFVYTQQVSTQTDQLTQRLEQESQKIAQAYDGQSWQLPPPSVQSNFKSVQVIEIALLVNSQGDLIQQNGSLDNASARTLASALAKKVQGLGPKTVGTIHWSVAGQPY